MAFRYPLFYGEDGGSHENAGDEDLRESSLPDVVVLMIYGVKAYVENQSVTLSVVGSAGNLDSMTDTRLQAGAHSTSTGNNDSVDDGAAEYPQEGDTAEPSTVSVVYDRLSQSTTSLSAPVDTDNIRFPVYWDSSTNSIQSMTLTDMYDTFIETLLENVKTSHFPYCVTQSATPPADIWDLVSTTPIFTDTIADVNAFVASNIPNTLDPQPPVAVNNYYLHKKNEIDITHWSSKWGTPWLSYSMGIPLYIDGDSNLKEYSQTEWSDLLEELARYAAVNMSGMKLRFNINGTGSNMPSGMVNSILNGTGNYQTRYVNVDDYRAQEFPDGTATTANTYYLKADLET